MAFLTEFARLEMPVSGLLVLAKTVGNFEVFQDRFRQLSASFNIGYPPTSGQVQVTGRVFPMSDISPGMSPDPTGIENIKGLRSPVGDLPGARSRAGIDDIVEFKGLGDHLSNENPPDF